MHREPKSGYGPFEAISIKPTGEYVRTRHQTEARAAKRLQGNRRHNSSRIVDHRKRNAKGELV